MRCNSKAGSKARAVDAGGKAPRRKGGRVYIDLRANGQAVFHEGYLSRKEAARLARASGGEGGEGGAGQGAAVRPELTSVTRCYLDLHRHAAARAALLRRPGMALCLMLAHAIAGSHLWRVSPEPQASRNEAVSASLAKSRAEEMFGEQRRAVLGVLGFDADEPCVTGGTGFDQDLVAVFRRLLELPDPVVMEVLCVVMGETLAAGSRAVDALGLELDLVMADWWQADEAFLDTLRDREVLTRMVAEVAGEAVAEANAGEKAKTLKAILRDHLDGTNGRAKVEGWVPRWMAFPPSDYTARGSGDGEQGSGAQGQEPEEPDFAEGGEADRID